MNKSQQNYDIAVVGAGMVGAALALGLAQQGWSVALLEQHFPLQETVLPSMPGLRVSAINCASVRLLQRLGVWHDVMQLRCHPYRRVETWEQSGSRIIFDAATLVLPELGFMVENDVVQAALWQKLVSHPDITLFCPATLQSMTRNGSGWQLTLDTGQQLQIKLLAGVDGAHSRVRTLAGIGTAGWQYRQACLLITVETSLPPQEVTWQKFFPSGPRAFLPLFERWASLAWYDSAARIRQLQSMPLSQLNKEIATAFPQRLGPVQACATGSFSLFRHHAYHYTCRGLILSGDAAHSIHPLAGQGVNLGYRDVAILLDVLNTARNEAQDCNSEAALLRYQRSRRRDNLIMQSAMDFFHVAFSHPAPAVKILRNLALTGIQRSPWLKRYVLRYALGLAEGVPDWNRTSN